MPSVISFISFMVLPSYRSALAISTCPFRAMRSILEQDHIVQAPLGFHRHLPEPAARVAVDDGAPEANGWRVVLQLLDHPLPAKSIEQLPRDPLSNPAAAELPEDEELADAV